MSHQQQQKKINMNRVDFIGFMLLSSFYFVITVTHMIIEKEFLFKWVTK